MMRGGEARVDQRTSGARPRERRGEPGANSPGLMLGLAGGAAGVFFLVLGLVGLAFFLYYCYQVVLYYR